jgi:hypothetical protein
VKLIIIIMLPNQAIASTPSAPVKLSITSTAASSNPASVYAVVTTVDNPLFTSSVKETLLRLNASGVC